ncbi:hypothetical protein [Pleomorphovibrio marinus]|uniref:hypothetical protein n=1 Tax=Pleomorphovibrio marinus TaxID=2164132 RepID=UPI000E0CB40A|nr:hypothetical protein [Pleomorphovibrio marinus]
MKAYNLFAIFIALLQIGSCGHDDDPKREGNAEVVINTTTRGGYQFLIQFNNELYYPENLPEEFKVITQEPIPVYIQFEPLEYLEDLFRPAPNDVPVFWKAIPAIRLLSIKKTT